MFRNTLTANDKDPFQDWENLSTQIQIERSWKPKFFSDFFNVFVESSSSFKDFEKKDHRHRYLSTEFSGCEGLG